MNIDLDYAQRIVYGLTDNMIEKVNKMGYQNFVDWQLSPQNNVDAVYLKKFEQAKYVFEQNKKQEVRTFTYLQQSARELFGKLNKPDVKEKQLPAFEVYADMWLRAIHSQWQLREMVVEFWHNHFNVNAGADEKIAIALPLYDATLRKHCLGNFRAFLEAVAKSPAMLYYLDNFNSKASPANENYARELFELHTLGSDNYLNHLYNRWKEVPGALSEKPIGYIDEDVYEAARAFTGWTVADGSSNEKGGKFENTGEFLYYEGWHDNYQKRVLGVEFPPNQPQLADGLKVLDLVAYHPATAKFICTKLCRRFIADNPPEKVVKEATAIWLNNQKSDDQIKKVLRFILNADEFKQNTKQKSKRPFELAVSTLRATQTDMQFNNTLVYLFSQTGQKPFMWETPAGHPDVATYWHNPNLILNRWNFIFVLLTEDWHKLTKVNFVNQTPNHLTTAEEVVNYWLNKFFPAGHNEKLKQKCTNFLSGGGDENDTLTFYNEEEKRHKFNNTIALMAFSPDFQLR